MGWTHIYTLGFAAGTDNNLIMGKSHMMCRQSSISDETKTSEENDSKTRKIQLKSKINSGITDSYFKD